MTSSPAPSTAGKANSTPAGKGGNAAKAIAGAKANAAEIEKAIADEKAKKAAAASAVDISDESGVKAATDALDISDGAAVPEWKPLWEKKLEEATASSEPKASDRLEEKIVPLVFTSAKMGAGVSLADDGKSVCSDGSVVGCQLADVWMANTSRNPLIWTCALELLEVTPETLIGVVGRNYYPSEWNAENPLSKSTQAVVIKCGDGAVLHKGKGTSFKLRKLESGARLNLILDLQTREMTIELVGKSPGQVLSSLSVENVPAGELTICVGFAAGGVQQRVRIVGCKSQLPDMKLTGKFLKDLWDEDNVQKPLALNVKEKERGPEQAQAREAQVAASMY